MEKHPKKYLLLLLIIDTAAVTAAFVLAYWLRQNFFTGPIQLLSFYYIFTIMATLSFLLVFSMFDLYKRNRSLFSVSYFVNYLRALFLWGGILVGFSFFTKVDYSRAVVLLFFLFASISTYLTRFFLSWVFRSRIKHSEDIKIVDEAQKLIKLCNNASGELPLLEEICLHRSPGKLYKLIKRTIDITLSLSGILILIPFGFIISHLIRRDSGGEVIIKQKRIGAQGKVFVLYKFRTMKESTPLYALSPRHGQDDRITRVGKKLRQYSIDELPQLWNVLKGEMSIVGPRPEMPFIVENYQPWQKLRLSVKPGITGLWQIMGRKDLPLEENLEYDLYHVFNQSFFLDLAIILKTLPHLLFPRGAY